ncbi:hypothetical protein [Streptomyces sp. NPDC049040]|uniref:hypothetical protein n=1 Tax=Streptomyces sp. NPDC049040 TaxID=3365593 RepID=UPI00371AF304
MSTGIHGGIEYRHPGVGSDHYEGEPWVAAVDLWPLYDQSDYAAFGCLFGVRNTAGYRPLAAGRGLPADLSSGLRADLWDSVRDGFLTDATWVSWADVASLDPAAGPESYAGRLSWSALDPPSTHHQVLVPARWPPEVVAAVGPRPVGLGEADTGTEWVSGGVRCRYESLAAGAVLGAGTHWPYVFNVMRALADRFGADGVRLVVAFD